jgi:hypothetical protein
LDYGCGCVIFDCGVDGSFVVDVVVPGTGGCDLDYGGVCCFFLVVVLAVVLMIVVMVVVW